MPKKEKKKPNEGSESQTPAESTEEGKKSYEFKLPASLLE